MIVALTSFIPYRSENHAANIIDFLSSLKRFTSLGMSSRAILTLKRIMN